MPEHTYNHKKGFTLIEVIASIAILAVVISMGYSLYIYGVKSFNIGTNKINSSENMRIAADYITRELRNATSVQILGSIPSSPDSSKNYIYAENGVLKCKKNTAASVTICGNSNYAALSLNFSVNVSNSKILTLNVMTDSASVSSISSDIYILNLGSGSISTATPLGHVVCYTAN